MKIKWNKLKKKWKKWKRNDRENRRKRWLEAWHCLCNNRCLSFCSRACLCVPVRVGLTKISRNGFCASVRVMQMMPTRGIPGWHQPLWGLKGTTTTIHAVGTVGVKEGGNMVSSPFPLFFSFHFAALGTDSLSLSFWMVQKSKDEERKERKKRKQEVVLFLFFKNM